jgi:hypothetical protein
VMCAHPSTVLIGTLLLVGCAAASQPPPYAADSQSAFCDKVGGDAFAAWQCQRFYARQKINGYCLKAPGGELGIRQCQQFYTRMAESPSPTAADTPVATSDTGPPSAARHDTAAHPGHNEVALVRDEGTFKVPVLINGALLLHFTVDSGAADVSIPADVVMTLGAHRDASAGRLPRHPDLPAG